MWLDQIGARPKTTTSVDNLRQMSEEIEKSINQVFKLHEFENITKTLFQNRIQREVGIKSEQGTLFGSETEGMQITAGTIKG